MFDEGYAVNIADLISQVNGIVWGPPMLALLLLTGLFLTIGLKLMPLGKIPYAFGEMFRKRDGADEGDVSPFGALMTALASTIGTGNIAGVAVAIAVGGPGALFWMWMTALVGMATKFSEAVLAVKYREVDHRGKRVGGPMYYIKNGLGKKWVWLGFLFAAFGMLASWGTGASIQSNSVADVLQNSFAVPPLVTGLVLAAGAGLVILGGINWIANVATKLVPAMALTYIFFGVVVIIMNAPAIPAAFGLIFQGAFGYDAAIGGFSGGALMLAMQFGVARGIFSNEAGQGSAPIAHAAAQNNDPVNQGIVAMLGTLIDTIIVCSITGLVIITTGAYSIIDPQTGFAFTGAPLTAEAFSHGLPGDWGQYVVSIGLAIFAFTTILGWSYYGERCAEYLFGEWVIFPFKIIWVVVVFAGCWVLTLEGSGAEAGGVQGIVNLFWLVADTLTGMMAAPNLIALLLLSPIVFKMSKEYFDKRKN